MDTKSQTTVETLGQLTEKLAEIRRAQKIFAGFSQEKADEILKAAALAASKQRIPLAKLAVEETGMGVVEDKIIKNHCAAEAVYNRCKDAKTSAPAGLIAAAVPVTSPTSTVIFEALVALKTRNGILFLPHPCAKTCTSSAAGVVLEAAVKAGAPAGIIGWVGSPSPELSDAAMRNADLVLTADGPNTADGVYLPGDSVFGAAPGGVPAVIHGSADIRAAVHSVIVSKTFDNGMTFASVQAVVVHSAVYESVKREFIRGGCHFLNPGELEKVRKTIVVNRAVNPETVGQTAETIAALAGIDVPRDTKVLIGEVESAELFEEFSHEKPSPVLAMYRYGTLDEAIGKVRRLVRGGGSGHTAAVYIDAAAGREDLSKFAAAVGPCRVAVNFSPSESGEPMLWFRTPEKVYFNRGSLKTALGELKDVYGRKKAFVVTDEFLYRNNYIKPVTDRLDEMGIRHTVFYDVPSDPTLAAAKAGARAMREFEPDCVIALGGGSPMDAGKIMWTLYEHPEVDFSDLAARFLDIRARIYSLPKMGSKAKFVAVPTSAGTGSEVTPFAVITDEATGIKYPLTDYALLPTMAVVDADLMMDMPRGLTAASGIDALVHALEAYVSTLATDYTDGLALTAAKTIFTYLPLAYADGGDAAARGKMANASTIAGIAFANAFLGLCHSMAHKLGAFFHLPHGIANALLISGVIRFNADPNPKKMGAFSQYRHRETARRYAEIASFAGIGGSSDGEKVNNLIDKIEELKERIGIKKTIREYGVAEGEFLARLDEMSEQAFDDQCTGANPRFPLISEIKALYLGAYYGE